MATIVQNQYAGASTLAQSAVAASCPVDTTEDVLATITVFGNTIGPNGRLSITTAWTTNNTAGNKTLRVRFGGVTGVAFMEYVNNNAVAQGVETSICNVANTASQKGGASPGSPTGLGILNTAIATANVDTTQTTTLVITGQKALATDTITLESYLVRIIPGA